MIPAALDHVGLFVSDLVAARRFCEGVLGLEWVEDDEAGQEILVLRRAADRWKAVRRTQIALPLPA